MPATAAVAEPPKEEKVVIPKPQSDAAATEAPAPTAPVAAEGTPPAAPAATPPEPDTPVEVFGDQNRLSIAQRYQARRAAEREKVVPRSHVPMVQGDTPGALGEAVAPGDPNTDPDAIPGENGVPEDPEIEAARARAVAAAAAANPAPVAAQTYTLVIDQVPYTATREELLANAGVTAADAAGLPDEALIRAAQMNIAAQLRLREANEARRVARQAPEPTPMPASPAAAVDPDAELLEMVNEIQVGDPKKAAGLIKKLVDTAIDMRAGAQIGAYDQQQRGRLVDDEMRLAMNSFNASRQDIAGNPVKASAHAGAVARQIADDILALVPTLTPAQYDKIAGNPENAARAYRAALMDGSPIRRPAELFSVAAGALDQAFRPAPPPVPAIPPNPRVPAAPVDRIAAKQALLPAGSGSAASQPLTPQAPPPDRLTKNQEALAAMRRARHQG